MHFSVLCSLLAVAGLVYSQDKNCNILDAKGCLKGISVGNLSSLCLFLKNGENITNCVREKTGCVPNTVPEFTTIQTAAKTAGLLNKCSSGVSLEPLVMVILLSTMGALYNIMKH
ncbi:unnamed protein product [Owenia fusiformis]|uniref:Uncharacterized protein n=1 Tax=Owenia fusiformis TaxID=6347 RepID=A0A8S4P8S4_OWEFU|nr:unnamed protein product [Owenia fusiformis]